MTNPPPALLESESSSPRRRLNRPELALWILGLVLLAASAALFAVQVAETIRQSTAVETSGTISDLASEVVWQEAGAVFAPGIVTAGLLSIALAIFLRGVDINARRRATLPTAPVTVASLDPVDPRDAPVAANAEPIPASAPVSQAESTAPTDYAVFMRPSENPADRAP